MRTIVVIFLAIILLAAVSAGRNYARRSAEARQAAESATGGKADRGKLAVAAHGCTACHSIPGVRPDQARVGPSLAKIGDRLFLGGVVPNSPDNLIRWIQDAPSLAPHTAMPAIPMPQQDSRDIAAYLQTLK